MTNLLIGLAVLFLILGAEEATRFVLRYRRLRWRRRPEGRHLMGLTRALAVSLWGTLIFAVVPLPAWVGLTVQAGVFGWLAFELNRRNRLLTANQREANDPNIQSLYRGQ